MNLAATVRLFPKGIHEEVKENAENLSQGQKQLLCIARALLRRFVIDTPCMYCTYVRMIVIAVCTYTYIHRTQILVVDEGTSAVDPQTDAQIQTVLREQAQKRVRITIIRIAFIFSINLLYVVCMLTE